MNEKKKSKKIIVGKVVSDKMDKTIIVRAARRVKHPQYVRFVTSFSKFKAHDEKNAAKIGDKVKLVETRPISKDKRWLLAEVLK